MQDEGINGKEIEGIAKQRSRKAKLESLRSKRKERRKNLSERENELMSALSLIDDLVFILDENGVFIGYNRPSGVSQLRVPPEQFVGRSYKQVLPATVSEQLDSAIKALLAENTVQEFDYCLESKDGLRWYRAKLSRRMNGAGEFAGVIVICRDITEHKCSERALQESENLIRQVLNATPNPIFVKDRDGRYILANKANAELHGTTPDEMVGKTDLDYARLSLASEQEVERFLADDRMVISSKQPKFIPAETFTLPDGKTRWFQTTKIPMFLRGNPDCVLGVAIDVTDRKRVEDSLRFTQFAIDQVSDAAFWILPDAKFIYVNDAACRLLGYSLEELLTMSAIDIGLAFSPEFWPGYWRKLKQRGSFSIESDCRTKDGKLLPVEITGNFMEFGGNQYNCAFVRDITERKRAENSLRFTQFAVDQVSDAAFWVLPDAKFIYVNDAACRLLGYSLEELLNMSAHDIGPVFSMKSWPDYWSQLKQRGSFTFESDCRTKNGKILPVEITGNFMEFGGGQYNCAFIRDITERKKAEQALRREHDLLRLMIDNLPDKVYVKDTKSRFVLGNEAVVKYEGMESEEELIGKTDFDLHPRELANGFYAVEQEIIKTGQPLVNLEELVIDKQGNEKWVLITKVPMRDENGRIIGLIGINRDITGFKRAEQALRDSEERYKRLSELTLEGIALHDGGVVIDVNTAFARMFGHEVDELKGKDLLKIIPAGEYVDIVREKIATGYTKPYEILARRKDGRFFPIEVEAREIILEGKKLRVAAVRDITRRKQAEKRLLDYQAQLKSLASQLTLAEERERRRIAMELHDQISQSLAVSKIKLDALRVAESSTVILDVLNEVSDSLMQVIHDTRSLTFDLSFPILYELGFEAAVAAWLADQIEGKHGIETEFEEDDQPKPLDDDVRVLLFRDVRELLINVVKHAHAKKVKVSISRVGRWICVSVQDDGVGFEPAEVALRSAKGAEFGLFSIRERLEQLGGQLEIESASDCGSKVTITAPLKIE